MCLAIYEILSSNQQFVRKQILCMNSSPYIKQFFDYTLELTKEQVIRQYCGSNRQNLVRNYFNAAELADFTLVSEEEFSNYELGGLIINEIEDLSEKLKYPHIKIGDIVADTKEFE
uniref:AAA-ATPase_like domain-containing protein n=1 Tax=Parastrongyloides trichosuri TaxID=131310 RepID=A0A0N4ZTX6_PARTI